MKIPKQVRVGRTRYDIRTMPLANRNHLGGINYDQRLIVLTDRVHRTGRKPSAYQQSHTFWHEITHAILHDMGHKLEANEDFVDQFARRINDVVHTAKF